MSKADNGTTKISCYQLKKDNRIVSVPWQGLTETRQSLGIDDDLWVDVDVVSIEEIEIGLRHHDIHPLIIADCLNPEHSTLIDRYPETLYIELPTNADPDNGGVAYLSIICIDSLIVTIRRGAISLLPRLIYMLENEQRLDIGNTSNLLYKIIDYSIEGTVNEGLRLRQQTNQLEAQLQKDPSSLDPNELADLRRHLTQLEFICADQMYCSNALVSHSHDVIEMEGQEAYFDNLVADSAHALRLITRLNGRLEYLQDNVELQRQYSLERRIRLLTILSAVFLPITFITGFFGMNFVNMGVLEWEYGLVLFTFMLLVIPIVMMRIFYSRGWFD